MRDKAKNIVSMDRDIWLLLNLIPSCGMERMKIYKEHGIRPDNNGVGVFERAYERIP